MQGHRRCARLVRADPGLTVGCALPRVRLNSEPGARLQLPETAGDFRVRTRLSNKKYFRPQR